MDSRRLGLALVVALLFSAVITVFFYFRFTRQQALNRAKTKRIVAAAVDLAPGTPIPATALT